MKVGRAALLVTLLLLTTAGCTRTDPTPRIRFGAPCVGCGMAIRDAHFACVRRSGHSERQFDSIECLLRAGAAAPGEQIFLADYDRSTLQRAESLWIVKGSFPSPMGGGLAAFSLRESAREVADRTAGRVVRLAEMVSEDP